MNLLLPFLQSSIVESASASAHPLPKPGASVCVRRYSIFPAKRCDSIVCTSRNYVIPCALGLASELLE